MDSIDLLAREDEFKKLNKQLEKKTESLMKQIEQAMQKQDIFSEFSQNLTLSPYHTNTTKKHCCNTSKPSSVSSTPTKTKTVKKTSAKEKKKVNTEETDQRESVNFENGTHKAVQDPTYNCTGCAKKVVCECCADETRRERITEDLEFLYAFISVSVQEKVLPPSFVKDRATVENVCKFLSSRVKLMQEQIDRLQATIHKKAQQCEVHLTHQAELECERMTLLNRANNMQAGLADMRAKYQATVKKLDEKDRLYKEKRSETDKLSSEVKRLMLKATNAEARAATLEDSAHSLKQQLAAASSTEKEYRDSIRSLTASHQASVTQLESRIKCLNTKLKRQEQLIKNLREQRALLTADGALSALEQHYSAFLLKDF